MNPRGRITLPTGKLRVQREDGEVSEISFGRRVMVVVQLVGHRLYRQRPNGTEFARFCRKAGIWAEPVKTHNHDRLSGDRETPSMVPDLDERGEPVAWECSLPSREAFDRLKSHPLVKDWWLPVAVSVPRGGGEPSVHAPIPKDVSASVARRIREMKKSLSSEGSDLAEVGPDGTRKGRKADLEPLRELQKEATKANDKAANRLHAFRAVENAIIRAVGVSDDNRADALAILEAAYASGETLPMGKLKQLVEMD